MSAAEKFCADHRLAVESLVEAAGAAVDWSEASGIVTVEFPDGSWADFTIPLAVRKGEV